MNRENILSGNARQYISIVEVDMLEQIGKLLPKYKSFNQLANDALRLGLPLLIKEKFNQEIKLEEEPGSAQRVVEEKFIPDESLKIMVQLLQEIVMNGYITKSVACSLFNAKCMELESGVVPVKPFKNGLMRDTPEFLLKYEVDMLNAMDEE